MKNLSNRGLVLVIFLVCVFQIQAKKHATWVSPYRDHSNQEAINGKCDRIKAAGIDYLLLDMTNWNYKNLNPGSIQTWPGCLKYKNSVATRGMYIAAILDGREDAEDGKPGRVNYRKECSELNKDAKEVWDHLMGENYDDSLLVVFLWKNNVEDWRAWYASQPDSAKTYLSKFRIELASSSQYDLMASAPFGWNNVYTEAGGNSAVRFITHTKKPYNDTKVDDEEYQKRVEWCKQAMEYSIYGGYEDNESGQAWGTFDNYYNIVKAVVNDNIPQVSIVNPLDSAHYAAPASIEVLVNASDNLGIDNVKLYINSIIVGTDKEAPYEWGGEYFLLKNLSEGYYQLKAVATNLKGIAQSKTINIVVGEPDKAPKVHFLSPLNNDVFAAPASLNVEVDASDEGSIKKVELFINDDFVGEDLLSPYIWGLRHGAINNLPAGNYTLKTVATDNTGNKGETSIDIVVESPNEILNLRGNPNELFLVYPNPIKDKINVKLSEKVSGPVNVQVYNLLGNMIYNKLVVGKHNVIDINGWERGVYLIRVDNLVSTETKIVIIE